MQKLLFLFFLLPTLGFGQTTFTIHFHDSFEVSDSIQTISFNLTGENTIKPWPGNTILIETVVKSEEANEKLLNYLKNKGRYKIITEKTGELFNILSENQSKRGILTKAGELEEKVTHSVFIPENFAKTGENTYQKKN